MKIRQIRNATILLDYGKQKILVDPMLGAAGSLPSLKYVTRIRRRNPLVELPTGIAQVLDSVTHILITHCQKGHFDHLDSAAIKWIRTKKIPVLCSISDENYLKKSGFETHALRPGAENKFLNGKITLVPCQHGAGLVGAFMAHGYGYILNIPSNPIVYVVGDSIMTDKVRAAVVDKKPDVIIMPAGGAQFDLGGEIIMSKEDVLPMANLFSGTLIVNHLEALDHCPVTREQVKLIAEQNGLKQRVLAPDDGEDVFI